MRTLTLIVFVLLLEGCSGQVDVEAQSRCDAYVPKSVVDKHEKQRQKMQAWTAEFEQKMGLSALPSPSEAIKPDLDAEIAEQQFRKISDWASLDCPGRPNENLSDFKIKLEPKLASMPRHDAFIQAYLIDMQHPNYDFWWVTTFNDRYIDFQIAINKETHRLMIVQKYDWPH